MIRVHRFQSLLRTVLGIPFRFRRFLLHILSGNWSTYRGLRHEFMRLYTSVQNFSALETPLWKEFNTRARTSLLPIPPWNFLSLRVVKETMLLQKRGALLHHQRKVVLQHWGKIFASSLLRDPGFGDPPLDDFAMEASHNTIHHAFHIAQWERHSGISLSSLATIIEWGGGYGNFARLCTTLNASATYIIIDTPLFCTLQWLYLRVTVPQKKIHLVTASNASIQPGEISIIPIGLLQSIRIPKAQLFVSTWALSESSKDAQHYVAEHNWFGAEHLLIGFQQNNSQLPDAENVAALALQSNARIVPIEHLQRQFYAFR